MHLLTLAVSAAVLATPAWSWGDEGHKITATIAQIHLLPSAHQAICSILPSEYICNLANVATWPDDAKKEKEWSWSAGLHFVNGVDDYPPKDCSFGTKGWTTDQNILNAIVNMTRNVVSSTAAGVDQDIALRFLTHFLGDIHQPLHLTGRDRGGNYVPVLFNGKNTSLHLSWDDLLILERINFLTNYTNPLPTSPDPAIPPPTLIRNRHIESALDGSNYDPLVRWIVLEGIYGWWGTELEEWTTCPQFAMVNQAGQQVMGLEKLPFKDPLDVPVCPYHWAKPSHQMLCDFIWRSDLQGVTNPRNAVYKIELNTPEYAGRIRDEKVVEKQLALGAMR
ncbi:unnamed protein product [Rhizoctonia solani]|uniref:Endonuclease 3 n=1 Tax=Rhizoctonia solani TaxID=456999 RepID=A0A8H3HTY4_9AGAM|nr:unnamed protein product [Rhizoctonia solani]